jgi:hypothetical protein
MSKAPHNDIIKKVAEEILMPLGMFRKGQSRCWFYDRGWFMIQVEFQPSAYSKGSYINSGITFLWKQADGDDCGDLGFDIYHREWGYAEYEGDDEAFYRQIIGMAELAKKKVLHYQELSDEKFSKEYLKNKKERRVWDAAMLCFLGGDMMRGRAFLQELADRFRDPPHFEWKIFTAKSEELLTMDDEYLTYYVKDSVRTSRAMLKKSIFKKLKDWEAP